MRRYTMTVFDDWVSNAIGNKYTAPDLNEILALPDMLAVQVLVENATEDGYLLVEIEHSADGRNWFGNNYSYLDMDGAGLGNLCFWFYHDGTEPSLRFVRMSIRYWVSPPTRVRINVTARDQG